MDRLKVALGTMICVAIVAFIFWVFALVVKLLTKRKIDSNAYYIVAAIIGALLYHLPALLPK